VVDANGNPIRVSFPGTQVTPVYVTGWLRRRLELGVSQQLPGLPGVFERADPLRNRSRSGQPAPILFQRQLEAQLQQLKNAALLDVRNTYIALTQDRAQVERPARRANCSSRPSTPSRKNISSAPQLSTK